jgi:hypothetical protein
MSTLITQKHKVWISNIRPQEAQLDDQQPKKSSRRSSKRKKTTKATNGTKMISQGKSKEKRKLKTPPETHYP